MGISHSTLRYLEHETDTVWLCICKSVYKSAYQEYPKILRTLDCDYVYLMAGIRQDVNSILRYLKHQTNTVWLCICIYQEKYNLSNVRVE